MYCGLDLLIVGAFGWQLWERLDQLIIGGYDLETVWTQWRLLLTMAVILLILGIVIGDLLRRIRRLFLDRDINRENKK